MGAWASGFGQLAADPYEYGEIADGLQPAVNSPEIDGRSLQPSSGPRAVQAGEKPLLGRRCTRQQCRIDQGWLQDCTEMGESAAWGDALSRSLERAPGRLNSESAQLVCVLKSKQRSQQPASVRPNRRRRLPSMPAAC